MNTAKILRSICGFGVFVGLMVGVSLAQTDNKRAFFTFNRPISLPGVTLPAGEYLFRLVDTDTGRKVIQVVSADGKTPYAMLHSIPDVRRDATTSPEVRFMETAKGTPSAIKAWWYSGESIGYEFIYPKEQARLLAHGSVEPILTTRAETTKAEETTTADLERLEPTGKEVAVAAAPEPTTPAGESQIGTVAPETVVARNELPTTATTLPLIGLIGILALAGAGGLQLWRTVRS
jgi:hypothetical protein